MKKLTTIFTIVLAITIVGCAGKKYHYPCEVEKDDEKIVETCPDTGVTVYKKYRSGTYRDDDMKPYEVRKEYTLYGKINSYTRHGGNNGETYCKTERGVTTGECFTRTR